MLCRFSTHWFRLKIEIPAGWDDEEVHLVWDSSTEAMVWKDGEPLQVRVHFLTSVNCCFHWSNISLYLVIYNIPLLPNDEADCKWSLLVFCL